MLLPVPLHADHVPAKIESILGSYACPPPYSGHRAGPEPLIFAPIWVMLPITQSKPYSKPWMGFLLAEKGMWGVSWWIRWGEKDGNHPHLRMEDGKWSLCRDAPGKASSKPCFSHLPASSANNLLSINQGVLISAISLKSSYKILHHIWFSWVETSSTAGVFCPSVSGRRENLCLNFALFL